MIRGLLAPCFIAQISYFCNRMKVLIVSTYDLQGGAAIAATRLLHALQRSGCDASMVVRTKMGKDPSTHQVGSTRGNKLRFYGERGAIFLNNRLSKKNLFDVSIANTGIPLIQHPQFVSADVIHLHWINQGGLSLQEIGQIVASGKKVVWTLHDMWPFTGICHHAGECTRYVQGCGHCPYLKVPSRGDLSWRIFQKKQAAYRKGNITFVACSRWLEELANKSPLTRGHRVVNIPNPINTEMYAPRDKKATRELLHLPQEKKIVLYAAAKASDPRKGVDYLIRAAEILAARRGDLMFLIAGMHAEEIAKRLPLPSKSMGYIPTDQMAKVYSAVDAYITPSLQENLPNTLMEAMACGTPCVGFDIGGIPEMITHKGNGYVAAYKNAGDFAHGIDHVVYGDNAGELSRRAREKVLHAYNESTIATSYKALYDEK